MKKPKSFRHFYDIKEKSDYFSIEGVGIREPMKPVIINRPRGTGDSLLMFFHHPVQVNTSKGIKKVKPGSMIYWEKCGHYYGNTQIQWSHSWVHFDGSGAHEIVRRAGLKPYQVFYPPQELLEALLYDLDQEMTRPCPDMVIAQNRFEILIREIVRAGVTDSNKVFIPEKMLKIKSYLDNNFKQNLHLDKLAKQFSISRPHLSAEFKRYFGTAPGEYLIERRLREAEILLLDLNLQISEVAENVGWNDVCHFSKIFKKHRGKTPSSLRHQ